MEIDNNNPEKLRFYSSFQGINKRFLLTFNNTDNAAKKFERTNHGNYFLSRVKITN